MLQQATRMAAKAGARGMAGAARPRVALCLAGCGVYDGSETTEVVSALIHLSPLCEVSCFSPNKDQHHVVDHTTGEDNNPTPRNVLVESARIARGAVTDLAELDVSQFDAL